MNVVQPIRGEKGATPIGLEADSHGTEYRAIVDTHRLARAKAEGITLGRRALEQSEPEKIEAIKAALAAGMGVRRIARENKAGVGTVLRVKAEMAV
jgi:hypothetical protein